MENGWLKELEDKKAHFEEINDLPIADFIDWGGLQRIVNNSIEVIKHLQEENDTIPQLQQRYMILRESHDLLVKKLPKDEFA